MPMPAPRKQKAKAEPPAAPPLSAPAFHCREYQAEAERAFDAGIRRQFVAWHRRAGKDAYGMYLAAREMKKRVGNYWHLFPLHSHARRALWEGIDPETGIRFIDRYFPEAERASVNNSEMLIRMKTGSTWQLLGSDHYDRLVGAGTIGILVSEWALCDPRFYEYARPIIRENDGWVVFITTFRGRNHAWQMFKQLEGNPEWFTSLRTIRDTRREDGRPVISESDVAKDRAEGMSESLVQQEYYCNPAAALPGSLYGSSITELTDSGRRATFAYDARFGVTAAWSLEFAPVNISVAFFQNAGNESRVIGSRSFMFRTLAEAYAEARAGFPWKVATHLVPPDNDGVYTSLMVDLGCHAVDVAPALNTSKAAMVTQAFLSRVHVDNVARPFEKLTGVNNELLLDSLNGYRLKESNDTEEYTLNLFASYERYLARAVEHYAAAEMARPAARARPRNYAAYDRGVI